MLFQQIKILLLSILGAFRRAMCCFRRRRNDLNLIEPLHTINVVVDIPGHSDSATTYKAHIQPSELDWNSWDDRPHTVEEHIKQYRERCAKPSTPSDEIAEPDFFSDITPTINPQIKYYLGDASEASLDFSRLRAKTDVPISINAELEDWVEEGSCDWEELDSQKTKQLIREKRREIRYSRQKMTKMENARQEEVKIGINTIRYNTQASNLINHS